MTYAEKLKDPRWQKKRLEVMEAADFKCQMCGNAEKTLHVHHVNYQKGAKPWEYEPHELKCFCEECHAGVEENIEFARQLCSEIDCCDLYCLLNRVRSGYFQAVSVGAKHRIAEALDIALSDVRSQTIISSIKDMIAKGQSIDDMRFKENLSRFLRESEVEK